MSRLPHPDKKGYCTCQSWEPQSIGMIESGGESSQWIIDDCSESGWNFAPSSSRLAWHPSLLVDYIFLSVSTSSSIKPTPCPFSSNRDDDQMTRPTALENTIHNTSFMFASYVKKRNRKIEKNKSKKRERRQTPLWLLLTFIRPARALKLGRQD